MPLEILSKLGHIQNTIHSRYLLRYGPTYTPAGITYSAYLLASAVSASGELDY